MVQQRCFEYTQEKRTFGIPELTKRLTINGRTFPVSWAPQSKSLVHALQIDQNIYEIQMFH